MIETIPRIGDEVFVHGYIDEIRKDIIIIRNEGGYFGTVFNEVIVDRKTESDPETPNTCETCRYEGECDWKQWQKCYCEPQSVRSNLEPFRVDEPQTCANGCKWLNQDGECTEPSGECHIEYRTEVDEPQTDCAWGKGEE